MDFLKIKRIFCILLFGALMSHAMHVQAVFFSLDSVRHFGRRMTTCLGYHTKQAVSLGARLYSVFGMIGNRYYRSCAFWPKRKRQSEESQAKNIPEDLSEVIKNIPKDLNEDIRVGNSPCKGSEVQIGEDVTAQQVSVLNQGNLSADCAYHALKNATEIVDELCHDGDNLQERVNCSEKTRNLFGRSIIGWLINTLLCYPYKRDFGLWRSIVLNKPGGGVCYGGDWLCKDDISYLISGVDYLRKDDISIIENYDILLEDGFLIDGHEGAGINGCKEKNQSKGNYTHSFILGTMNGGQAHDSCNKGRGSGSGHWIAVVVQQEDGKRNYIVADSKGHDRLLAPPFKALIHKLEGEEIAANIDAMSRNVQRGSLALIPEKFRPDSVLGDVGTILPLLQDDPRSIERGQVEELRERIGGSIEYLSVLLPRFNKDHTHEVEADYQSNFSGCDLKDYRRCYEELGFQSANAENITLEEAQDALRRRAEEGPAVANGVSKWRQIRYLFSNSLMKQEYDAFIKGPNALLKLQHPNQVEYGQLYDKYQRLLACGAEISSIIQSGQELQ